MNSNARTGAATQLQTYGYASCAELWQVARFRTSTPLPPLAPAASIQESRTQERALVLEFLPACVANAKTNSLVGFTILLEAQ